jgi:hypothetical protein
MTTRVRSVPRMAARDTPLFEDRCESDRGSEKGSVEGSTCEDSEDASVLSVLAVDVGLVVIAFDDGPDGFMIPESESTVGVDM